MSRGAMRPALRFLLAARQSELHGLEQLSHTCQFVSLVGELVHALQKERGYSILTLCQDRADLLPTLDAYTRGAESGEARMRGFLDSVLSRGSEQPGRARLYSCIAYALYRLDELPDLRWRVRQRKLDAQGASLAFTRLVSSLLAVVFEAADASLDAGITRLLVALLNFMQGKELSGQERAYGVLGYTAGYFTDAQKAQMAELAAGQQRCFEVFGECAPADVLPAWQQVQPHTEKVQQLRGMARQTHAGQALDPGLAELWFELCTARIDAMAPVEQGLADTLARQCAQRIEAARAERDNHRSLLDQFAQHVGGESPAMLFNVQRRVLDVPPEDGVAGGIERSMLDMLQDQAARMRQADQALSQARGALDERKRIERAKWLLVQKHGLTEPAAHERLQRAAMESGMSLADVAQQVLDHPAARR
ncbi:nitrate- and nitrite sensing domain-containing protein [Bordetella ansorpii]|nr:nitrate- and nitrite sensing domain-containing protein [Bordetella ansorpii]